ncbi:MAG: RNA polymerase factor sigma-54 [candidate division WOR-3 bacterium]
MKPDLQLTQKQIITPQLITNLKILTLPNPELETLVQNEIEQNPALEIISGTEEANQTDTEMIEFESDIIQDTNKDEFDLKDLLVDDSAIFNENNISLNDALETTAITKESFEQNLLNIIIPRLSNSEIPIAEYIIGNLDNQGFLKITIEEICQHFSVSAETVTKIIHLIQQIEPGGIASHNLQEALLIQLKILGFSDNSIEVIIIRDYYDLLLNRNFSKLAENLKVSENIIYSAILNLKQLDPVPARRYLNITTPSYINPDFTIIWQNDKLIGFLNDENIPSLRIARNYRDILLNPKNFSDEIVKFARSKVQNAINLIKAIESRKTLLQKIINYIIENQLEFLTKGKEYLKPLSIRTLAEKFSVHISTISRAIQGKYVETPVGIFPLKYFFSSGVGDFSRNSIKEKISNFISNEDKKNPLTDDAIVKLLANENINISRRTVAKYREEMNIPSSNDRIQK